MVLENYGHLVVLLSMAIGDDVVSNVELIKVGCTENRADRI